MVEKRTKSRFFDLRANVCVACVYAGHACAAICSDDLANKKRTAAEIDPDAVRFSFHGFG